MKGLTVYMVILALVGSLTSSAQQVVVDYREVVVPKGLVVLSRGACLGRVATFVEAWRAEAKGANIAFKVTLRDVGREPVDYKLYNDLVDSTFMCHVYTALGVDDTGDLNETNIGYHHVGETLEYGSVMVVDRFSNDSISKIEVDVSDFDVNGQFVNALKSDMDKFYKFKNNPIAKLNETLHATGHLWGGRSLYAELFYAFQKQITGCDISLFAPASFSDSLGCGEVYVADVKRVISASDSLIVVPMRGGDVAMMLEKIYNRRFYTLRTPQDDVVRTRVSPHWHIVVSGLKHTVNLTKIGSARVRCEELEWDKIYRVALNQWQYREYAIGLQQESYGEFRTRFIGWLMGQSRPLSIPVCENFIDLQPKRWVMQAHERELKELQRIYR